MKAIILSISSDIGLELSKAFTLKDFEVFGTYNKSNPKTTIPNKNNDGILCRNGAEP